MFFQFDLRPMLMRWNVVLALAGVAAASGHALSGPEKAASKPPAPPPAQPLNLPGEVSDERMEQLLDNAADLLLKSGQTVKMSELLRQLQRRSCSIGLPKLSASKLSAAERATRTRAGVLVIGDLYKCKKCPRWHVGVSSGFMLNEAGACATCYHVVNVSESPTLIAMTGDGRIVPVREVLAANPPT